MTKLQIKRSKLLSLILRHDPGAFGLTLDEAGWLDVSSLLKAVSYMSFEDLEEIVTNNDKKRFEFNEDRTRIRASQGHSIEVDLGYEEREPPETLYHGTSNRLIDLIFESGGLHKMERHHVHLSADLDTALRVARRRTSPVVLTVRASAMHANGFKFYLSTNGVWLTDTVPKSYLTVSR